MMQQVATQRSEIAALPIDIDTSAGVSTSDGQQLAFADVFNRAATPAEQARKSSSASQRPDNTTDAKSVDNKRSVSSRDSQTSREPMERNKNHVADEHKVTESAQTAAKQSAKKKADVEKSNASENGDANAAVAAEAESETNAEIAASADTQSATDEAGDATDWLSFVDAVRRLNEGELNTGAQVEGDVTLATSVEALPEELHLDALISGEELFAGNGSDELEALIAGLKEAQKTQSGTGESNEIDGSESLQALAEALNEAVNALIAAQEEESTAAGDAEISDEEAMKLAAAMIAAMNKASGKDVNKAASENAENAGLTESELEAEAALLVSLMKAEMSGESGADNQQSGKEQQTLNNSASANAEAGIVAQSAAGEFAKILASSSEESQTLVTDNLADKVVALLPDNASEGQKAEVKQGVIDAVKQFQAQLQSGSEQQSALEAMIAGAIEEAGVAPVENLEVMLQTEMRQLTAITGTASQLAQGTTVTALASLHSGSDTTVADIQQARTERSAAQQAADADKPVNIHQPEGQQQLAEKVRWMVNARNSMAEIRLDPPELGSMQVRVNVSGDAATVNFVVQSAQARDALAQAEPRLREMLAEQGISLGESFVSQQQQGGNGEGGEGSQQGGGNGQLAQEAGEDTQVTEQSLTRQAQGGIDDYA